MNAPQERGSKNFYDVQNLVLEDRIKEQGVTDVMKFIIENAPLFRFFAEHLPEDLRVAWNSAETDTDARAKLEEHYGAFHSRITDYIETFIATLDPDTFTALNDAVEEEDVDKVSAILDRCIQLEESAKDRIEE